jgi:plastocyanin
MTPLRRWTTVGAPLALMLATATALSAAIVAPVARAQEAEPPHPAHIHSGTCDELGDIVAPLPDVKQKTAGEVFGNPGFAPVEVSETDVPLTLSAILASPHAVNIHESKENIQNYIACGNIGGRVVDGELLIGLKQINDSGFYGIAKLDQDSDSTHVVVYLAEKPTEGGEQAQQAAPAATNTPAAAAPAATDTPAPAAPAATETPAPAATTAPAQAAEVPVDIRNFSFSPNPVEVPVGGTVTWTNQDQVPHTATSDQRGVLQSGAIAPGSSFSQTFDTAGTFNYHCEFHPNMTGTIIVK